MPIRVLVYGKLGDSAAYAALNQVRALIRDMRIEATAQIITDEAQLRMNGIDTPPAVSVDGLMVSNGWVPSRGELTSALQQRQQAINASHITERM
jgi:hypothetical protein